MTGEFSLRTVSEKMERQSQAEIFNTEHEPNLTETGNQSAGRVFIV